MTLATARTNPSAWDARRAVLAWTLPVLLSAAFIARCVILSRKRLLFGDEFFTWYPVSAPLGSMLASTADTINTAPPLYFVLGWAWAHVLGSSALSLRLFSALAASGAILAMFAVLRRVYGSLASAVALTVAFIDPELLLQSSEARFYMLLLAEVAAAIVLLQRLVESERPSRGLLAANAGLHACMVMTHYFGLLYSALIMAALVLASLMLRRNPVRGAASVVAGWIVFVPWIPVFLRHLQMGRPSFWIPVPTPSDLAGYYVHFATGDFWLLVIVLCALAALTLGVSMGAAPAARGGLARLLAVERREVPLLCIAVLLALFPAAIYLVSIRPGFTSTFLDRYLLPVALGWAILCAHACSRVWRLGAGALKPGLLQRARTLACAAFVVWCGASLVMGAAALSRQEIPPRLPAAAGRTEPVVVEYIHEFMGLHFYAADGVRYRFLLDTEAALKAGGGEPANQQVMAALKRHFPEQFPEVMTSGEFLAGTCGFWVKVHKREWWQTRISNDPRFVADSVIPDARLVHVSRRP
jgi:hypothetical protein